MDEEKSREKKRKILIITHQLSRTGAPIVLLDMIRIFWKAGYDLEVITMLDGELREELAQMQIPIKVQERFMDKPDEFFQFAGQFQMVVANTLITFEAVHLLKYLNIPVLWWLHEGRQYFEYFRTVLPDFQKLPSNIHVFSVSHYVQKTVEELCGAPTELLHFGVQDVRSGNRRSRGNKVRFLTAGTYSKVKAQDVLVEAIGMLPEEYLQRAEFYFCGNEKMCDEAVFFSVKNLCEAYENVMLLHQLTRQQTMEWMEQCDCVIVPSRIEPFSAVAVEMMMKGNLCLCTEVCGVAHYIEDGVNGFIVPPEDPEKLKEKIIYIIENCGSLEQIREAGRKSYEQYFSLQVFEEKVLKLAEQYCR